MRKRKIYLDFSLDFHFPSTNCDTHKAMFSMLSVNLLLSICGGKRKQVAISN
jgi:hypothetical protein